MKKILYRKSIDDKEKLKHYFYNYIKMTLKYMKNKINEKPKEDLQEEIIDKIAIKSEIPIKKIIQEEVKGDEIKIIGEPEDKKELESDNKNETKVIHTKITKIKTIKEEDKQSKEENQILKEEKYILEENDDNNDNNNSENKIIIKEENSNDMKIYEFALRYFFSVYIRISKKCRDEKRTELFKNIIKFYILSDIKRARKK